MSFTELSPASLLAPSEAPTAPQEAGEPPRLTSATIRLWQAFSPLPLERRRWALTVGAVEAGTAGDNVRLCGEVAVVVSGCLAIETGGSALAADILRPGDVAATGSAREVSGQWITAGELYQVKLSDWLENAGVEGLTHLLDAADARRGTLERRVLCATEHRATARVADLLLTVQGAVSQSDIQLSQERLGTMLGLRRTTVNGSCRALEAAGASRTKRGHIRIIDEKRLAILACGCRHAGGASRGLDPESAVA